MAKIIKVEASWCKMPMALIYNPDMQRSHLAVFAECDFCAGRRGWFYDSQEAISQRLGISLSSVNHALSDLKKIGYIDSEPLGVKYGSVHRYVLPSRVDIVPPLDFQHLPEILEREGTQYSAQPYAAGDVPLRNRLRTPTQPAAQPYATGNVLTTDVTTDRTTEETTDGGNGASNHGGVEPKAKRASRAATSSSASVDPSPEVLAEIIAKYVKQGASEEWVQNEIAAALNNTARFKVISLDRYVQNWVRRDWLNGQGRPRDNRSRGGGHAAGARGGGSGLSESERAVYEAARLEERDRLNREPVPATELDPSLDSWPGTRPEHANGRANGMAS